MVTAEPALDPKYIYPAKYRYPLVVPPNCPVLILIGPLTASIFVSPLYTASKLSISCLEVLIVIPPPIPVAKTDKVPSDSIPNASPLAPVALPMILMAFAVEFAEVIVRLSIQ